MEEGAKLDIYDPKVEPEQIIDDLTHPMVTDSPENVKQAVQIHSDPYSAVRSTHAIVLCTEWDEFIVSIVYHVKQYNCINILFTLKHLDYKRIYQSMMKPAYIFDGRKILDHDRLQQIGFHVQTIGKKLNRTGLMRTWGSIPQL